MLRTQIDAWIRCLVIWSMLFTHLSPTLVLASPAIQQEEPTATATPTETVEPAATETATVPATVEVTETPAETASPTETATETIPPTETPTATASPAETAETGGPTATEVVVETVTVTPTEVTPPPETATALPAETPSPTLEASPTLTYTAGPPVPTATETVTPTPSLTPTFTVITPTVTLTPTATLTPTVTPVVTPVTLSLLMGVEPPVVAVGEWVTVTLTISNPGPGLVENLVLSTTLPVELNYEQPLGSLAAAYEAQSRQLSWQIPALGGHQAELRVGYLARLSETVTAPGLSLSAELSNPKEGTSTFAQASLSVTPAVSPTATPSARPRLVVAPPGPPARLQVGVETQTEPKELLKAEQTRENPAKLADLNHWLAVMVVDAEGQAVADGTEVVLSLQGGKVAQERLQTEAGVVTTTFKAPAGQAVLITASAGQIQAQLQWPEPEAPLNSLLPLLKGQDPGYGTAAGAIHQARHRLRTVGSGLVADNASRWLNFDRTGLTFQHKRQAAPGESQAPAPLTLGWSVTEVQVGNQSLLPDRPSPAAGGTWVTYRSEGQPWQLVYEVGEASVEQYFIFEKGIPTEGDLVIEGRFETSLQPVLVSDEVGLRFESSGTEKAGEAADPSTGSGQALAYGPALVEDGAGRRLRARLELQGKRLRITVPADWLAQAEFPVIIDPVIGPASLVSGLQGGISDPKVVSEGSDFLSVWVWQGDIYGQRILANRTLTGSLITVSQAEGLQSQPALAYNPASDEYLVVWKDERYGASYPSVRGQRLSAEGQLLGDEIELLPPSYQADHPAVAAATGGTYLVAWSELPGGNAEDLFGQVVSATGVLSGTNLSLSAGSGDQKQPVVAYDSQEDIFLVAWQDSQDSTDDIYTQLVRPSGVLSGSNQQIAGSGTSNKLSHPAIAADGAGQFLVAWDREVTGSNLDVEAAKVSATTGQRQGNVLAVRNRTEADSQPTVVRISTATYAVAWYTYDSQISARLIYSNDSMDTVQTISAGEGWRKQPATAAGSGQYMAVWQDSNYSGSGQSLVIGQTSVATTEIYISPFYSRREWSALTYQAATDNFLLAWQQALTSPTRDILVQGLDGQGQPLAEPLNLTLHSAGQERPAIEAGQASSLVVWQDSRNSGSSGLDIYGQLLDSSGALSGSLLSLSTANSDQLNPAIAYNSGRDEYLVVWDDNRNGNRDIYGQIVRPDGSLGGTVSLAVASSQSLPDLAYNVISDTYLLVWEDTRNGTSNTDVYGRVISASGATIGSDFAIATATLHQYDPVVAYGPNSQRYLVSWWDLRSGVRYDLYGQVISGSGVLSGSNFAISNPSTGVNNSQAYPAISTAPSGSSDEFLITWSSWRNGAGPDIYGQRISAAGQLLDEPDTGANETNTTVNFPFDTSSDYTERPTLAYRPGTEGIYLVAWNNRADGGIYAQRYSSGALASPTSVFTATPLAGVVPLTVTFTNLSTGTIAGQLWNFGDGTPVYTAPLTMTVVTHTYLTTGTFTAVLTLTNPTTTTTATLLITVTEQVTPSMSNNFEGVELGNDPTFWVDQLWDTTPRDDFEVLWAADPLTSSVGTRALGPSDHAGGVPIYSHYAIPGWAVWQNYEIQGRLRIDEAEGGIGIAVYSRYPAGEQKVYVLRRYAGSAASQQFHLFGFGSSLSGDTDLGVTPQPNTWYHFRLQALTTPPNPPETGGNGGVSLRAKVWPAAESEPAGWQALATDTSATRLTAGAVGVRTFGPGEKYFDDLVVTPLSGPVAAFQATPESGFAPLTITFTNLSLQATNGVWDFGDGTPPTSGGTAVVSHTYTQTGLYTVTLQASDGVTTDTVSLPLHAPGLEEGLQAYWRLEESSGQRLDSSSNGNHLTATTSLLNAPGQAGQAADLESDNNDYLRLEQGLTITGSLTLAGWLKPESLTATVLVAKGHSDANRSYRLSLASNGSLSLELSPDGSSLSSLTSTTNLQAGQWSYVAAVFEAGSQTAHLYLNGVLEAEQVISFTTLYSSSAPFSLGGWTNTTNTLLNPFDGLLDEWRVYNRALSGGEIQYLKSLVAPVAAFTATPVIDSAPLTVTFSNNSNNSHTYLWNFGDGLTSTLISPTHTYTQPGVYTVSLKASSVDSSDILTRSRYITVSTIISGSGFSAFPTSGPPPLAVLFFHNLSGVSSYLWDFGDGLTSTVAYPSHLYEQAGSYTVTLTTDGAGGSQMITRSNYISASIPAAGEISAAGGVITSTDQRVTLEFAPGAVTETLRIYAIDNDLGEVYTTTTGEIFEPLPLGGLPFRTYGLEAERLDGTEVPGLQFQAPVTFTYNYLTREVESLIEDSLSVVYHNPEQETLEVISTTVNSETLQLTAVITHFSDYGIAGEKAAWTSPSIDAFTISLAKGSASYSYDIPLPTGPGGFSPKLTLQYDSGMVNGMIDNKLNDSGWVGIGWALDLGQVSWQPVDHDADEAEHLRIGYNLQLNGISEELKQIPGGNPWRFQTQHETYMQIALTSHPRGDDPWMVTDKDGTQYYFGVPPENPALGSHINYVSTHGEGSNYDCNTVQSVRKLYKVVDVYSNTMEIEYQHFPGKDCDDHPTGTFYPPQSYPKVISYTTNPRANDSHVEYRVEFSVAPKGYEGRGDVSYKLTQIKIFYQPEGGAAQTVRTLKFHHNTNTISKTNVLTGLQLFNGAGNDSLPPLTFSYEQRPVRNSWVNAPWTCRDGNGSSCSTAERTKTVTWFRPFLDVADNGYGAKIEFDYETVGPENLFQMVKSRQVTDTVTTPALAGTYQYQFSEGNLVRDLSQVGESGVRHYGHINYGRFYGFGKAVVIDPLSNVTRHHYDNSYEPHDSKPGDPGILNGRELETWFYDAGGHLYSASRSTWVPQVLQQLPGGKVYFVYKAVQDDYTCDGSTNGTDLNGCTGRTTTFEHDPNTGNLLKQHEYDENHSLYRTTTYNYTINESKNLLTLPYLQTLKDAAGQTIAETRFHYDNQDYEDPPSFGQLTAQRVRAGDNSFVDTRYKDYDAYGNAKYSMVYSSYGTDSSLAATNPLTTTMIYGDHGLLPIQVTNPKGQESETTYDYRFQLPLTETDPNEATTSYSYDSFGRLVAVTLPACTNAPTFEAEYGDGETPYRETIKQRLDACGSPATYAETHVYYDGFGRKIQGRAQSDTPGNFVVSYVKYDILGRVITSSVPSERSGAGHEPPGLLSQAVTETEYDPLGRVTKVIQPDGAASLTFYQDYRTAVIDPNQHLKISRTDAFGRLVEVKEYAGTHSSVSWSGAAYGTTTYEYDVQDHLLKVKDTGSNQTTLTYDKLGRKIAMADPDMGQWYYYYDALGNLIAQVDAKEQATNLYYDELNRLKGKTFSLGVASPNNYQRPPDPGYGAYTVTYRYDATTGHGAGIGRRTSMTDTAGTVDWSYDIQGRVLSEKRLFSGIYGGLDNTNYTPDNPAYVVRYSYDMADRMVSTTYPDGEVVTTTYTLRSLPASLVSKLPGGGTASYISSASYNALGNPTSRTTGSNLTTSYSYYSAAEENNRLEQIQVGDDLLKVSYGYDNTGNITTMTDQSAAAGGQNHLFTYDHLDRLTSAGASNGSLEGYDETYSYDTIGNLTGRNELTYNYPLPGINAIRPHAVLSVTTSSGVSGTYQYDDNGNMTHRVEGGITYTQSWNVDNKLKRVTWVEEGQRYTTTFVYNGDSARLLKIEQLPPIAPRLTPLELTTVYIGGLYEEQFETNNLSGQTNLQAGLAPGAPANMEGERYGHVPELQLPHEQGGLALSVTTPAETLPSSKREQAPEAEDSPWKNRKPAGLASPLLIMTETLSIPDTGDEERNLGWNSSYINGVFTAIANNNSAAGNGWRTNLNFNASNAGWVNATHLPNCPWQTINPPTVTGVPVLGPCDSDNQAGTWTTLYRDTFNLIPPSLGNVPTVRLEKFSDNDSFWYINGQAASAGNITGKTNLGPNLLAVQTGNNPAHENLPRNLLGTAWRIWVEWTYQGSPTPTLQAEPAYTKGNSNTISWNEVTSVWPEAIYDIERSTSADFLQNKVTTNTMATSLTFNGLAHNVRYYYHVRSRNAIGQTSGWSTSVNSLQDSQPPTVVLTAPAYSNGPFAITWNGSDSGSGIANYELVYTINSGAPVTITTSSSSKNFSSVQDGQLYTFKIRARDVAGNTGAWTALASTRVDTTPPTAPTLTAPANNSYQDQFTIYWQASSDGSGSGIAHYRVEYQQNGGSTWLLKATATNVTYNFLNGQNGYTYTFRVVAVDRAGNTRISNNTRTFIIDKAAPQVTSFNVTPRAFSPNGGTVQLSATMTDIRPVITWTIVVKKDQPAGTGVYTATGAGKTISNWSWNGQNGSGIVQPDDDYYLTLTAKDGLRTSNIISRQVLLDSRPPTNTTLYKPGTSAEIWPASVVYTTAQTALTIQGTRETESPESGQSEVTVVKLRRTQPATTTEVVATLSTPNKFSRQLANYLTAGLNTLVITHTDAAGNHFTQTRSIYVDTSLPSVVDYSPTGMIREANPLLSGQFSSPGGSAIDTSSLVIRVDGEILPQQLITTTATGFSASLVSPLAEGDHSVRVSLANQAGTAGETGWFFTVNSSTRLDLDEVTLPEVLNQDILTVTGRTDAGNVVTMTLDGLPVATTSAASDEKFSLTATGLSDGLYEMEVSTADAIGNTKEVPHTFRVNLNGIGLTAVADPSVFAPNGAFNTTTLFKLKAAPPPEDNLEAWRLQIWHNGQVVTETIGQGSPENVTWDGRNSSGQLPQVNTLFQYTLLVTSSQGVTESTPTNKTVLVDVAAPLTPVITYPVSGASQGPAITRVDGTAAEAGLTIVVWAPGITGSLREAGRATVEADLTWSVPRIVLNSGMNVLTATATDKADQDSPASLPVSVTVRVEPPLEILVRSPIPAGLNQTLLLTATARGIRSNQDKTVKVEGQLPTQAVLELLSFSSTTTDAVTSTWTVSRPVDISLGDSQYNLEVVGWDASGYHASSYIGVEFDVTPPGNLSLIDPVGNRPIKQSSYRVKGKVDPSSRVVLVVDRPGGSSVYTTTAGHSEGIWETLVSLGEGENILQATAYDQAGNASTPTDPVILTWDVTPPELTATISPQWQQPSEPLTVTAVVTEASLMEYGDVWVAWSGQDAGLFNLEPQSGSNSWQREVTAGEEGVYTATVSARDEVGNVATQTLSFTLDQTPPALSLSLAGQAPYSYGASDTVYYGPGSGRFTVTVALTDSLSRLGGILFPATTSSGQTYLYDGLISKIQAQAYTFAATDTFSGPVTVIAADRAENPVSQDFTVLQDLTAPVVTMTLPAQVPLRFSVAYSATDSEAGVRHYDIQYKTGGGNWTGWLTGTTETAPMFIGTAGESYTFQVRATDQVGNVSGWIQAGPVTINSVTKYYMLGGERVAMRQGNELYYLHGDHLGSTSLTTDQSGNKFSEVRYLPYGQDRWTSGATPTDFGFTGQRKDGFGLYDYNARYYSAVLGRFISPDSIVPEPGNSQAWNRYAYTLNNPIKFVDPTGHTVDCGLNCDHKDDDLFDDPPPPLDPPSQEVDEGDQHEFGWDGIPDGFRIDFSAWVFPPIGAVDVNIDLVTANLDPQETSVVIGGTVQLGLGEGVAVVPGLIWHNATKLDDYKTISNMVGATGVPGVGVEPSWAWSGTTEAKSFFFGVGAGEEFSGWYGKQLVTFDPINGDLSVGGESDSTNLNGNIWDLDDLIFGEEEE